MLKVLMLATAVVFLPLFAHAAPKSIATEAAELKTQAKLACDTTVGMSTWCRASYSASDAHLLVVGHIGSVPEQLPFPLLITTRSRLVSATDEGGGGVAENDQLLQVVLLRPFHGSVRQRYVPTVTGTGASRQAALMDVLANYADEACGPDLSSSTTVTSDRGKIYRSHTEHRIEEHATCVVPAYRVTATSFNKKLDQWQVTLKPGG